MTWDLPSKTLSTCEAEYVAAASCEIEPGNASKSLLWRSQWIFQVSLNLNIRNQIKKHYFTSSWIASSDQFLFLLYPMLVLWLYLSRLVNSWWQNSYQINTWCGTGSFVFWAGLTSECLNWFIWSVHNLSTGPRKKGFLKKSSKIIFCWNLNILGQHS